MPCEVTVEITISDSESIPYVLLMGADSVGFMVSYCSRDWKGNCLCYFGNLHLEMCNIVRGGEMVFAKQIRAW